MKVASIYALVDPDSGMIRYIGKANDPAKRLQTHARESRRLMRPVNCWVRSLGRLPDLVVLRDNCHDWEQEERRLIASARASGYPLLNVADGGATPKATQEQRRANGLKTASVMRGDIPRRRQVTAVDLIVDTYEWLARYAIGRNYQRLLRRVLARMALRYQEDPKAFAQWGWVSKYV